MKLKEIKPGVIHCKTQEEADALVNTLREDVRWKNYWKIHKEHTCFRVAENGLYTYGSVGDHEDELIIEFSDLIIPELSAAEVLRICNEMCHNDAPCSDCKIAGNCFFEKDSDYQKVVEICEKWKADHEKKEPEFEWVDICRIIEVQDNGFKKCVHEEVIVDADLPFGYKECTTEMILKEYMKSHSGNYFATVEHVCRVKQ